MAVLEAKHAAGSGRACESGVPKLLQGFQRGLGLNACQLLDALWFPPCFPQILHAKPYQLTPLSA